MTSLLLPRISPRSSLQARAVLRPAVIPLPALVPGRSGQDCRLASGAHCLASVFPQLGLPVGFAVCSTAPSLQVPWARAPLVSFHCPSHELRERAGSLSVQFALPPFLLGKLASSQSPHIASPALSTGGSVRACRLNYDSLRMASMVGKKLIPSVPARTRRSSHCQRRYQAAHSKRAGSPMTHFAWPVLLPGSSLQACPLALGGHPAGNTAAKKLSPSVPDGL